ncbi:hypothetical protein K2173_012796 [Erythroxylum novogranatense]|uniref:Uncharacterized protein n=1 Tax=Erythroxylum novogranatense TaxID=1862640 RepID=A0AAV8S6T8_9ROSI|nr:hypothetical protein K2173_012796 [Erythroxylum novogranatense]
MSTSVYSVLAATSLSTTAGIHSRRTCFPATRPFFSSHNHSTPFVLRVANESNRTEVSSEPISERTEADKIVDGMDFGELCDEFECISSPLVESTARQLARDILELREGNRALGTYAVSVRYKDPLRSFTGREKYKRLSWATGALDDPYVTVQEMVMLSTSVLSIKWTLKGKPKSFIGSIGGDLIIKVKSKFTLNQISGQVIEHEEIWDLSGSSAIGQAFFWTSRRLYSTFESGKDLNDFIKNLSRRMSTEKENLEIYPDPSGDPTKVSSSDVLTRKMIGWSVCLLHKHVDNICLNTVLPKGRWFPERYLPNCSVFGGPLFCCTVPEDNLVKHNIGQPCKASFHINNEMSV